MTKERVIGKNNNLPWHIPEDLKTFKEITHNTTVIMGRKTYESIPAKFRPLPNRNNIVISRSFKDEKVDVCSSIEEGIKMAESYGKEIFVIGGSTIYQQTLPLANKLFVSYIKEKYEGDVLFPEFNLNDWEVEYKKNFNEFEFVVYKRK